MLHEFYQPIRTKLNVLWPITGKNLSDVTISLQPIRDGEVICFPGVFVLDPGFAFLLSIFWPLCLKIGHFIRPLSGEEKQIENKKRNHCSSRSIRQ